MSNQTHGTIDRAGIAGSIHGYRVMPLGDVIVIGRNGKERARTRVDGLAPFVGNARMLALGWAQFPDDAEVIDLYDTADACFG